MWQQSLQNGIGIKITNRSEEQNRKLRNRAQRVDNLFLTKVQRQFFGKCLVYIVLEPFTINMPSKIEHQSFNVKYIKIKSKCIIDLNVKYIIKKLLEENLGNI